MKEEYIKREDAIRALAEYEAMEYPTIELALEDAQLVFEAVPSADVVERDAVIDGYNTHEWCTGCKEYDQERHCCPRWNDVIRRTVEENKVVNCIGCKWAERDKRDGQLFCKVHTHHYNVDDFHFCGYGEREEDNE